MAAGLIVALAGITALHAARGQAPPSLRAAGPAGPAARAKIKSISHEVAGASNVIVDGRFTIAVVLKDSGSTPVCGEGRVSLRLLAQTGQLRNAEHKFAEILDAECQNGHADLVGSYFGPIQSIALELAVDGLHETIHVDAVAGEPAALQILRQPPPFVRSDTLRPIKPPPQVRLEDKYGNRIPGKKIVARIIGCQKEAPESQEDDTQNKKARDSLRKRTENARQFGAIAGAAPPAACVNDAQLGGATAIATDSSGVAVFDSLVFLGREGSGYRLCFVVVDTHDDGKDPACHDVADGHLSKDSAPMRYNVNREYNRNLLIISAIHSVAGTQVPTNELFDLRFRFRLPWGMSSLISADIPFQRKDKSDSTDVKSTVRDVLDALYMLNYDSPVRLKDPVTDALERLLFGGGQLRILAGVPYGGAQLGSIEMGSSLFFGSMASVGFITPLSMTPVKLKGGGAVFPVRSNIVVDAFLRSSGLDFMKFLNLRASFLVPLNRGRKVQSRLAIAVPIGTITPF